MTTTVATLRLAPGAAFKADDVCKVFTVDKRSEYSVSNPAMYAITVPLPETTIRALDDQVPDTSAHRYTVVRASFPSWLQDNIDDREERIEQADWRAVADPAWPLSADELLNVQVVDNVDGEVHYLKDILGG